MRNKYCFKKAITEPTTNATIILFYMDGHEQTMESEKKFKGYTKTIIT